MTQSVGKPFGRHILKRLLAVVMTAVLAAGLIQPASADSSVLKLPDSLTVIKEEAFAGCGASTVIIPDSVTEIGAKAFACCPNLTDVYIPDHEINIAEDAFEGSEDAVIHVIAKQLTYRYASRDEGVSLLLSNQAYHNGFSQNDLDFRMQKKNATLDEYLAFAAEQVLEFTDEEKAVVDVCIAKMNERLASNGCFLPASDRVVFVKTTSLEESEMGVYTYGNQIYLVDYLLDYVIYGDEESTPEEILEIFEAILWHEWFHCLTRSNPEFRRKMYEVIHFTIADEDFPPPPGLSEYYYSNPDVEHHDAYASFRIDGQDMNCYLYLVTTKHFEEPGDVCDDYWAPMLIPIDGRNEYYTVEEAENFYEVFGENTDYLIDPEECLADNFAYAMVYGLDAPYATPEIIEGILSILMGGS